MTKDEEKKAAYEYFCRCYPDWNFLEHHRFKSYLPPSFISMEHPISRYDINIPFSVEYFEYQVIVEYKAISSLISLKRIRVMCGTTIVDESITDVVKDFPQRRRV